MGAALSSFLYHRSVIETLFDVVEHLTGETLFNGSPLFRFAESLYIKYFDKNIRQKVTYTVDDAAVDHENPRVVGRNRRPAHALLRAFGSRDVATAYWADSDRKISTLNNVHFLTGEAGEPLDDGAWRFLLVGSPAQTPAGWAAPGRPAEAAAAAAWGPVALPSHWQLQGHDVPIYTNTAYPFAFDPPRARRTGQWVMTGCDMGLGADTTESAPLHPKEPGENATGLYRRQFALPARWDSSGSGGSGGSGGKRSRYFLVFEGVDACMNVYIDGAFVGFSKDSCLPAEFDVTQWVADGKEHTLAVQVAYLVYPGLYLGPHPGPLPYLNPHLSPCPLPPPPCCCCCCCCYR
jgi:hypothetical protein